MGRTLNESPAIPVHALKEMLKRDDPRAVALAKAIPASYLHGIRFKIAQNDYAEMVKELNRMLASAPRNSSAYLFNPNPYFLHLLPY
jgi:hypothetical protein